MFCLNQLPSIRTEVSSFFQKLFITVARPTYSISICSAADNWNMLAAGCFPLTLVQSNTKTNMLKFIESEKCFNKTGYKGVHRFKAMEETTEDVLDVEVWEYKEIKREI